MEWKLMNNIFIHTGLFKTKEKEPTSKFSPSHSLFNLAEMKDSNTASLLESTLHSKLCKFYPYTDPLYMRVRLPRLAYEWSTAHHVCSQVQFKEWEQNSHDETVQQDDTVSDVMGMSHEAEVPHSSICNNQFYLSHRVDENIATMSELEGMLQVKSHTVVLHTCIWMYV